MPSEANVRRADEVANTIIEQIGRPALFMLGAKDLLSTTHEGRPGLCFKIRGSEKGNFLRITLERSDTYVVELVKSRGTSWKQVGEVEGVYADSLHGTIERLTGLYTSL